MNFTERCSELLKAIEENNLERVKQLLDSGIPANTVLHSFSGREHATVLGTAAYEGQYQIVQYLLSIGTNVNFQDPRLSQSALHWAVIGGSYDVIKLLLENGADVNCKDRENATPILRSSAKDKQEIAKLLIDHGANVNHQDRFHSSLLHKASFFGSSDIINLTIKAGCIQNNSSVFGLGTPLSHLFYHGDVKNCTLLIEAGYNLENEHSWIGIGNRSVPASDFQNILIEYLMYNLRNPRSLKNACRLKIRESFRGQFVEAKIKRIPLPPKIISYLLLEDL